MANNHRLEYVNKFTYLGSIISLQGGAEEDIKTRLGKARSAFANLQLLWRSSVYSQNTNSESTRAMSSLCSSMAQSAGAGHNIHQSNVLSVLLYGSECWRRTQHTPEQCPLSAPLRLRVLAQDTTYTRAMSSLCSSTAQSAGAGHNKTPIDCPASITPALGRY